MLLVRLLVPFGIAITLAGCVAAPPAPTVMVLPAKGKDQAAFQQDEQACRQAVAAQSARPGQPAGAGDAYAAAGVARPGAEMVYAQCMAAKGNTVQPLGVPAGYAGYPGYPAYGAFPAYAYGYPYPYDYPDFYGVFDGGWGWGWGGGWGRGGWGHGWGHAGWGHGGWGHGGWGHGGGGMRH